MHLIAQVLDEEGLDDGMEHWIGQVADPPKDVDLWWDLGGVHPGDDEHHDNHGGPRYEVGYKESRKHLDELLLLVLVPQGLPFLLHFNPLVKRFPPPEILLQDFGHNLVGPNVCHG